MQAFTENNLNNNKENRSSEARVRMMRTGSSLLHHTTRPPLLSRALRQEASKSLHQDQCSNPAEATTRSRSCGAYVAGSPEGVYADCGVQ